LSGIDKLIAKVPFSAINWLESIEQNANPAYEYEKEIRLVDGSLVTITSIQEHNGSGVWYPVEDISYPITARV